MRSCVSTHRASRLRHLTTVRVRCEDHIRVSRFRLDLLRAVGAALSLVIASCVCPPGPGVRPSGAAARDLPAPTCLPYPADILPEAGATGQQVMVGLAIFESAAPKMLLLADTYPRIFGWHEGRGRPVQYPRFGDVIGVSVNGVVYTLGGDRQVRRTRLESGHEFGGVVNRTSCLPLADTGRLDATGRYVVLVDEDPTGDRLLVIDECELRYYGDNDKGGCRGSTIINSLPTDIGRPLVPDGQRGGRLCPGSDGDFFVVLYLPGTRIQLGGLAGDQLVTIESREGTRDVVVRRLGDGQEKTRWPLARGNMDVVAGRVLEWNDAPGLLSIRDLTGQALLTVDATPARPPHARRDCIDGVTTDSKRFAVVERGRYCEEETTAPRFQVLDVTTGRFVWGTNDPEVRAVKVLSDGSIVLATGTGLCTVGKRGRLADPPAPGPSSTSRL
jgi:hypothetical protein